MIPEHLAGLYTIGMRLEVSSKRLRAGLARVRLDPSASAQTKKELDEIDAAIGALRAVLGLATSEPTDERIKAPKRKKVRG